MRSGSVVAALLLSYAALAQAETATGIQTFNADYFEFAHPTDAYDMIRKLPGFELIDVDDEVRGFSGSRGNVLFDGRAPSGKQESLEQMLKRIPASSVVRIELIRGGSNGTATGNYELIANVVRAEAASRTYSVQGALSAAKEIGVKPDFRLELSNQSARTRLEGALALETDIDDDSGSGSIVETSVDGTIGREDRDEREYQRILSADGEYKVPLATGDLVANFSGKREITRETVSSIEGSDESVEKEYERLWSGELGGQYNVTLRTGELEGLVVQRLGKLRHDAEEDDESFEERTRTSETIARAEYRRGIDALRYFASLEGALNSLDSTATLAIDGEPIPISGSDAKVSERRMEGAFGGTWKAAPNLLIEPSMRAEFSNIRSSGDNQNDDSFFFLKPRLRATWDNGGTRLQATVEREVAQLDFEDFVASAELDRDDVLAGAVSLKPPATWSVGLTVEQRFWEDGSLSLSYRREWIDDVIDRVVIVQDDELLDAVGNIGAGKRRIIKADLTAPFDRLGIAGMQFRASFTFLKSRVTDPVTGDKRIISEDRPFEGDLSLTHDIPGGRWSWGAEASLSHHEREYRFDEVREERKDTSFGLFVEFRPARDWRLRTEAENLSSRSLVEERDKFDGLRSVDVLDSIETRRIETSPIFVFSVRKAFGSPSAD